MVDLTIQNDIIHLTQLGHSAHEIARQLRVSRNTIRSVLNSLDAARNGCLVSTNRRSKLDDFDAAIRANLTREPGIRVTELLKRLQRAGYTGSYTILRERVRQLRPMLQTLEEGSVGVPGSQVDVTVQHRELEIKNSAPVRVILFVYRLRFSQFTRLRFIHGDDLITVLHEHVRAFEWCGGTPIVITYWNVPTLLAPGNDDVRLFNPLFLRFANHYGFKPRHAVPQTFEGFCPNLRMDEYCRSEVASPSVSELNSIVERQAQAAVRNEQVREQLVREREALIPLPKAPWLG